MRKRLPPDTRPKWDDPNLPGPFGLPIDVVEYYARSYIGCHDYKPKIVRDAENYSIDGVSYAPDGFKPP